MRGGGLRGVVFPRGSGGAAVQTVWGPSCARVAQTFGRNALHWAVLHGRMSVVEAILSASRNALVNQTDVRGVAAGQSCRLYTRL